MANPLIRSLRSLAMTSGLLVLFSSLCAIPRPLIYAQEPAPLQDAAPARTAAAPDGLNQHMALDLRNMDIVDTLKFLAIKGNINIIASKDVAGRVSLFLKDVTIKDALDIILDAKKTGMVSLDEKNNQVVVTALSDRMKEAEALVKSLDRKTKQVLLEARIVKVILKDNFDMGIDWDKIWTRVNWKGLNLAGAFAFPAETTVMVKDGNTIIIGGMRKDEKVKTQDKFPILGDIPFVGMVFRKTS